MKKKNLPALGLALALLLVFVMAAAIDYRALNSSQFTTSGSVTIISGARMTNAGLVTPAFDTLKNFGGLTVLRSISNNVGEWDVELGTGLNNVNIQLNHNTTGGTNMAFRDSVSGNRIMFLAGDVAYLGGTGISNLNASSLVDTTNVASTTAILLNNSAAQILVTNNNLAFTGLANTSSTENRWAVLTISNSSASTITMTLPAGWTTDDGLRTYYVTNGSESILSVRARGVLKTNAFVRPLW